MQARACLDLKLERFGMEIGLAEKDAAAMAVADQFRRLDPTAAPAPQTAPNEEKRFSKRAVHGLLAKPVAATETSVAQAQEESGCFLKIFPPAEAGDGLKIAIKDIFRFDDHYPTAGLAHAPDDLGLPPSPLIARLRAAGGHIAATTKLSAWCYLPLELNDDVDPPRNPLGEGLLLGGSSSGSAAAVASGAVQVALGSDTGGSIRIPAALSGVYGFKPSKGAIPERGAVPLGDTQDTIGLLANYPSVLRSVFEVLTTLPEDGSTLPRPVAGIPDGLFSQASPQAQFGRDRLTKALRGLGIEHRAVAELDLERMNAAAGLITGYEAARFHGPRMAQHPDQYPDSVRRRLTVGLAVSDPVYGIAQANRSACLGRVRRDIFTGCGWILAPVVNRHGLKVSEMGEGGGPQAIGRLSLELLSLNRWVNLLGLPAISIPIPVNEAVPAAVQIVGAPGSDRALLTLACALDAALRQSPGQS
ncbi:amidase family protein [Salipiger abyssi]|uniref:Aspartyl-tRNA(Asn)/glutamyl-tRNA(Gln) amidotransferase subunit A n=1 Tax=Salipiger abyssi TaxID=1250539 RepID=A0A1P8UP15_9RHOB|nr:amidase [Salipiger abyssi]APZ51149.1 aspartyl-tRNA(Asn)/glutamyl-tRNA(Gln) amidotransferase subunit A [Salipiger abyssi]